MKILKLSESHGWSGGAAQLMALAQGLRQRGHEVKIGCPPGGELWQRLEAERFALQPFSPFQDYDVRTALRLKRWVVAERPDLVHAHHSRAHAVALVASLLSGRSFPALVVTRRVSFRIPRQPFSRFKYRSSRIAGYIAVSSSIRERLLEAGVEGSRIETIPSGTRFDDFAPRPPDGALLKELAIGELPVVAKIGHHGPWKGQDVFLGAAAEVLRRRPAVFILVGRDTDGPELRALAQKLGISSSVRLLGFRRDIPRILSCVSVSVNAAREGEGISGALRESLAMGVPVVASDAGGNAELVAHGETGELFPAGDASALAQRLLGLLEDPARARKLAEAGRLKVLADYSVERMVERTLDFYARVLARGRDLAASTSGAKVA